MNDSRAKFQQLLRELFQFDCADLDFGIYRIMNHKRAVIERFIAEDLPRAIGEELEKDALAAQAQAMQDLQAARKKVLEALGDDALDADGNLDETYREKPVGKAYLAAQERAQSAKSREALEAAIYNHLYAFFSRYWQDGDFISKRRYSRKERYAIPYNGEEVYLYWANHDQYYVKTGEYFTDYTWKAPNGVTVRFQLKAADVEPNNVKGEKRFFLPRLDEIAWAPDSPLPEGDPLTGAGGPGVRGTLTIPFEFRPLTAQEAITYGQKNQQEAIVARASAELPKRLAGTAGVPPATLAALTAEKRQTETGETVTLLEHHLRQYTRRNTSDFFIHKDLHSFLARELDFYLKNEVLNLDELETAGEGLSEDWFQLLRLIKRIGLRIIKFLAQIEDFQKMLWEKKKFVTETFYVITVGNIPEAFYEEIAVNEAQWEEWRQMGFVGLADAGSADVSSAHTAVSSAAPGNADVSSAVSSAEPHKGWYSRGYLPHFDAARTYQSITFRLHDSVPAEVIARWKAELHWTEQTKPDSKEAIELRKRIEKYEDSGHGACYLHDERIAALVVQALKHFDGERYHLIAWCVMPNHVHVLIQQAAGHSLPKIIHSWKSYTAHEANKLLGRSGDFWMPDYFDRFIRDQKHFDAVVEYIHQNPFKAGLVPAPEEWPWSSATAGEASVSDAQSGRDVRDPRSRDPRSRDPRSRNPRVAFLKAHPNLPLDTRHFPPDFVNRLLASFDNLDELTDGLLVHSENWQALNLLQEKYRARVKCVHIDPPYNTQTSGFLYKNDYQHSSWLAMMQTRLAIGWSMVQKDGSFACHIDENEYEALHFLSRHLVIPVGGTIVWDKKNPMLGRKGIATQHEYVLWLTALESPVYLRPENVRTILRKAQEIIKKHGGVNEASRREFAAWIRNTEGLSGGERAYCYLEDDGRVFRGVSMEAPEPRTDPKFFVPLIHPVTKKPCPVPKNGWSRAPETIKDLMERGEILFGKDETTLPNRKIFLTDESRRQLSSLISDSSRGKNDVDKLGLEFPYCHPVSLYEDLIGAGTDDTDSLVLDYFAGSGTTGHAVINLNREDGGRRKFILVEMADYFDTVLLPRIKKVTFSPEWKDGRPRRTATQEEFARGPRLTKVIRLESYEDALNNLAFDESGGQTVMQFEDYLLQYMLKWETRKSETLLNVEQLSKPFDYSLHLHRDGETRLQKVDLPETFAYLIGLDVETRRVYAGGASVSDANTGAPVSDARSGQDVRDPRGRYLVYRGTTREGQRAVVIWRETEGWTEEEYKRDRDFVAAQKMTEGADLIYVNGDSFIPGARALEGVFKARMFAGVEG